MVIHDIHAYSWFLITNGYWWDMEELILLKKKKKSIIHHMFIHIIFRRLKTLIKLIYRSSMKVPFFIYGFCGHPILVGGIPTLYMVSMV